ncbi:hypothetical protein [uncultured Thiohalocapsa sp.]|uniref:hypothetical protein n=1 Tax=uncultured Thiohalocapsa sp. TaxID=768990 RepID=UPI0025F30E3E|nr:hypothetical protein [uncultured Thiohalocapsa sp.]
MFPSLVAGGLTLVLAAGHQVAAQGAVETGPPQPPAGAMAAQFRAEVDGTGAAGPGPCCAVKQNSTD